MSWPWDDYLKECIRTNGAPLLDIDGEWMKGFCPSWSRMFYAKRVDMWAALFKAIAKQESGWNPGSMYFEFDIKGGDSVTGKPVIISEGLFQLSYADAKNYRGVPFRWDEDAAAFEKEYAEAVKHVSRHAPSWAAKDLSRTILDPHAQIRAAVAIASRLVVTNGQTPLSARLGRYWSCMRSEKNGKPRRSYSDIRDDLVEACPGCNVVGGAGV